MLFFDLNVTEDNNRTGKLLANADWLTVGFRVRRCSDTKFIKRRQPTIDSSSRSVSIESFPVDSCVTRGTFVESVMHLRLMQAWLMTLLLFELTICDEEKQQKKSSKDGDQNADKETPEEPKTVTESNSTVRAPAYTHLFKLDADFGIEIPARGSECYFIAYEKQMSMYLNFEVRIISIIIF